MTALPVSLRGMRYPHSPEDHALVRGPALEPPEPGARPPQTYDCSCGAHLPGTSRREAKAAHTQHRDAVNGNTA